MKKLSIRNPKASPVPTNVKEQEASTSGASTSVPPIKKKLKKISRLDALCNDMNSMILKEEEKETSVDALCGDMKTMTLKKEENSSHQTHEPCSYYVYVPMCIPTPPTIFDMYTKYVAKSYLIPHMGEPTSDLIPLPIQWRNVPCYQSLSNPTIPKHHEFVYLHLYTMFPNIQSFTHEQTNEMELHEDEDWTHKIMETYHIPTKVELPSDWIQQPTYLHWFLSQLIPYTKYMTWNSQTTIQPWWVQHPIKAPTTGNNSWKTHQENTEDILSTYRKRRLEAEEEEKAYEEARKREMDLAILTQEEPTIHVIDNVIEEEPVKKPLNCLPPPMIKKTLTIKKKMNVIPPKKQ